MGQQRRAEASRKVMSALAPVEAGQAQGPPRVLEGGQRDSHLLEGSHARLGQGEPPVVGPHQPATEQGIENPHGNLTGQVIVADPGPPQP